MERLPRGRHGLSREFVANNQRQRLIFGLTEVLYEVGYQATTVSLIGQRAAVSKSDFYKHFESKDECFCAAYDAAVGRVRERVGAACDRAPEELWSTRVREGIAALLMLFAADPALASIALVEGLRAGPAMYERYQAAVDGFVPCLSDGAPASPEGGEAPLVTHEAVVGGIASLLGRRVLAGEAERLGELLPELLEFALSPYVGVMEARRIVSAG